MTRPLADPAINHRVRVRFYATLIEINFGQLFCGLEGGVILGCGFPWHAFWPGNVTATQHTFLRVLRHVRDFAFVFAGRTYIDQRLAALALSECFIEKCADLLIEPLLRHRIVCLRIFRDLARHWPLFCFPLVAAAVQNFHLLVPEQSESPESVAG